MIFSNSDTPFLPLKARVSTRLRGEWRGALPEALIYRAIDEAESVARTTAFPHLFFPELAAEKVRAVHLAVTADFSHRAAA
jgi:hypothetical protein